MRTALLLLALALPARADEPAPPAPPELKAFGIALFTAFSHQQHLAGAVFNSQDSERITQSSQAERLQFEWRWRPEAMLVFAFLLPTRDELVRQGDKEIFRFHYPKQLLAGAGWDLVQHALSKTGTLELGLSGGLLAGLVPDVLNQLFPWVQADARVVLSSGSSLQAGLMYAGLGSRGAASFVLGACQRF